jgi:hypothetical protein
LFHYGLGKKKAYVNFGQTGYPLSRGTQPRRVGPPGGGADFTENSDACPLCTTYTWVENLAIPRFSKLSFKSGPGISPGSLVQSRKGTGKVPWLPWHYRGLCRALAYEVACRRISLLIIEVVYLKPDEYCTITIYSVVTRHRGAYRKRNLACVTDHKGHCRKHFV